MLTSHYEAAFATKYEKWTLAMDVRPRSVDSSYCEPADQSDPGLCHAPLIVAACANGRARGVDESVEGVRPSPSFLFANEHLLVDHLRIPQSLAGCFHVTRLCLIDVHSFSEQNSFLCAVI